MQGMPESKFFSESYAEALRRFLVSVAESGGSGNSYPIRSQDSLSIDVATLGARDAPTVLVSSGLHGIEGFFGSAIQLALLEKLQREPDSSVRYVLVHALNPYGFANLRRVNEDSVDLNRNFHSNPDDYAGAPQAYAGLDSFLNPTSAPPRIDLFKAKAVWLILRHGFHALKQVVAGGQYEHPRGLFFGGNGPCESTRIVFEHCQNWIGEANRVVHIDLHSGLGGYGDYKLLLNTNAASPDYAWYATNFGQEKIEPLDANQGTAYHVSGLYGNWMQERFSSKEYRFLCAEFGTYPALRVLASLRRENRAYRFCKKGERKYADAKAELKECFCPSDLKWKNQVVRSGLAIIEQAAAAVGSSAYRRSSQS